MPPIPPPPREKRLLGTSLKMYFDLPQTKTYLESFTPLADLATSANLDLFIIPTFLALPAAATHLSTHASSIALGAQDCHADDRGAHTGDTSAVTLAQTGVRYVEIGHAERRRDYGETDAIVAHKAVAAARNGLIPLICIGETARDTSGVASQAVGRAVEACRVQVRAALSGLPTDCEIVLAYEPVWAIGAAEPADAEHVVGVTQALRAEVAGRAGRTRILYGGSAGPGTFAKVKEGVDGLFLGRFAHDIKNMEMVIKEMAEP